MNINEIKKLVSKCLPGWEIIPGKKEISEKAFKVQPIGGGPAKVARIKNGKAEIVQG